MSFIKQILKKAGEFVLNTMKHIHFIGIGGYGMSAIARVMLEMGYTVTGSDVAQQDLTEKLRAKGATIHIGHHEAYVGDADTVVYSTALPKDNVERVAAEARGIPVLHRSEMLARLLNAKKGVAVAGAHGKTTTSSMIAYVLERCGVDPSFIIGGEVTNLGTNAKAGTSEFVVAEADESDGSFLAYHPHVAVVTNIEADHLENYGGDFERLKAAYVQFLSQVEAGGTAVVCKDDKIIRDMIPAITSNVVTYGLEAGADYTAVDITARDRFMYFTMKRGDEVLGQVELSIPGNHNVLNAMATLIVSMQAGVAFADAAASIRDFTGAKRRYQIIAEHKDVLVIDDYAHHPTEIEATLVAAKATGKRIVAVFQPQRYSRTYFLFEQFSQAFGDAQEVIITDIYSPAGEKPIEGVHASTLVDRIRELSNANTHYIPTKEEVQTYLEKHIQPGDMVLTMGAGDIWRVAYHLAEYLRSE
ncbi:UDP-N-acetylmuramate--L-alanine ligase [Paenibacillus sp. ACRRX]|uniref:UDP-N-acetylmuramate--L-alanine ligase n=1 Tax=Paenibacillus sp. ACRRX TaxID=2918206 RepID=UPI001EF5421A|nr:UDP-N-acetylmuramate--L-alanine ligase [Paenibacillus sp. ACRRX]MCG7410199.1 UDP-N-acetylmuramate--L-alanine ligase [Paenibacillus sp. ACRRX]